MKTIINLAISLILWLIIAPQTPSNGNRVQESGAADTTKLDVVERSASATQFVQLGAGETGIEFVSPLLPDHEYSYLYHSGMTCSGLATGDLDGDGRPDLFLANGPAANSLYLQTGEGIQFEDVTDEACPALRGGENWAAGVAMADVDNDGDLDIYVCNYESENSLFINLGPGDGKRV